uniref:Methylmalonyl-CoA mutase n=1 Tax=candidate division WOR-3 bacterium TaxID=2052148 RepID=A0A7V3PTK1_UNCW3
MDRRQLPDEELKKRIERWEKELVEPAIKKLPERSVDFKTVSGIPVKRVYTPLDRQAEDYVHQQGLPGCYPFTRGVQPTMYRSRFWTMRQYAGFGSAEETNARYHYLLKQGQTGLSVAFDLPTQMGYDSDSPWARGEVGKVGVAISTVEDMATLFKGIPLDRVSTSMTINATAGIVLAMYCVVAERQGVKLSQLQGTIQNDILKEYVARGTYIFPPRESLRLVTDIIAWCAQAVPKWNTMSISGYHIREAGATAIEEVAFTLANGLEYVQAAVARGLDVNQFAPRLSFFFAAHSNIFEEVAKFRAARRLWARLLRSRYNAVDEACKLRFHTQTGGVTLTAQQPENNIIRVAYQALAAVLGGTQSLHTNSRDEALSLPTEESVTIALRTQQILAYESGVADTVDPLAGSYFVESLTDEIEHRAELLIEEIEKRGGATAAIEQGFIQERIAESAYRYQQEVERGERVVVGVNKFQDAVEPQLKLLRVDERLEERRRELLSQYREKRDQQAVAKALRLVSETARTEQNLMPVIVAAVRAGATLGEISDALRQVFGEYDRLR